VADIYKEHACTIPTIITEPTGSLLVNNNLKFREFLVEQVLNSGTVGITSIQKNGLTHNVKFEVVSSASVNSSWKSKYWSINPTGSLLTANRDRTHEISVTFGPADPDQKMLTGASPAR
jgi:hypothetical protein